MHPHNLAPVEPIGFHVPGVRSVFMDDHAKRIEDKVDRVLTELNKFLGAEEGRRRELDAMQMTVNTVKADVDEIRREQSRLQGMMDLVKWVAPGLGLGAGAGGSYLMNLFGS